MCTITPDPENYKRKEKRTWNSYIVAKDEPAWGSDDARDHDGRRYPAAKGPDVAVNGETAHGHFNSTYLIPLSLSFSLTKHSF